jgi:hypothetical protein
VFCNVSSKWALKIEPNFIIRWRHLLYVDLTQCLTWRIFLSNLLELNVKILPWWILLFNIFYYLSNVDSLQIFNIQSTTTINFTKITLPWYLLVLLTPHTHNNPPLCFTSFWNVKYMFCLNISEYPNLKP